MMIEMGTGGQGRLLVNGKPVGQNRIAFGVPLRFSSYSGEATDEQGC
jgi:hypothetical protein